MCSLLLLLTLSAACGGTSDREGTPVVQESPPPSPPEPDPYLNPNLADGFDFPVGNPDGKGAYTCLADGKRYDSWYKAVEFAEIYTPFEWIHPGEDWNGVGGGNTDLGQPVHSIAKGMVDLAEDQGALWGKVIVIRHEYVENGSPETVFSLYVHLGEMLVEEGQAVQRREQIGTVGRDPDGYYYAHLHLEIRKSSMENYPPDYWPSSAGNTVEWVREHYYPPT